MSLNKEKIFKKTKAVFDYWFFASEENEEYQFIADKIFEFYIDKKKKGLWKKRV